MVTSSQPPTPLEVVPSPPAQGTNTCASPKQSDDAHHFDDDGVNTDGREIGEWKSKYPADARTEIQIDAFIAGGIFALTLLAIFFTWRGDMYTWLAHGCKGCDSSAFYRYAYFVLGGLLGGSLFGIKYLYKVVARNRWSMDRRLWRIFSPLVSGGLALVIAALTDSGILGLTTTQTGGASFLSLGFISGYFADSALAKMQEIAETVFGSTTRKG